MEKKDRESSSKLLKSVLARAANDPDTPIRADSPEFAEVPRLLTASGWEWMLDEELEHYGLPGATLLYTPDSTEAGAAFARDCWEIYFSKNAFRVNHLMYLPELLLRRVGGVEVARKWLKTVHVTVSTSEVKENQSGWVQRTLEGLLKCESLEEGKRRPRLGTASASGGGATGGEPDPRISARRVHHGGICARLVGRWQGPGMAGSVEAPGRVEARG
jgi:hypothetical protein